MAWPPVRVSNAAKRSRPTRIHAMHPVHKNRTGQPWDKPGHDELCGKALLLFESDSEEPALAGVSKDEAIEVEIALASLLMPGYEPTVQGPLRKPRSGT